jgi:hypothetical protein
MQIDVKASSLKILANVEANERQVKKNIEVLEDQLKQVNEKLGNMKEALREIEVLKGTLLHISCDPVVQNAVSKLLESVVDPAA